MDFKNKTMDDNENKKAWTITKSTNKNKKKK